jgi:hypothetical protein
VLNSTRGISFPVGTRETTKAIERNYSYAADKWIMPLFAFHTWGTATVCLIASRTRRSAARSNWTGIWLWTWMRAVEVKVCARTRTVTLTWQESLWMVCADVLFLRRTISCKSAHPAASQLREKQHITISAEVQIHTYIVTHEGFHDEQ